MARLGMERGRPILPYTQANWLSRWCYAWVYSLLEAIRQGALRTTESLYACPPWLSTTHLVARFETAWLRKETAGRGWVYLVIVFSGWWLWWSGLLTLAANLLQAQSTELMSTLIAQLKDRAQHPLGRIYFTACMLVAASLLQKLFLNQSLFIISTIAYMVRAGSMGALFARLLQARPQWNLGSGLNRLSIDTNRICTLLLYGHLIWSGPLRILLVFRTTLQMLGTPALYGVGFVLLTLCSLFWLAHRMHVARKELVRLSDERLQLTGDVLKAMRTIKSLATESAWMKRIEKLRQRELQGIRRLNTIFAVSVSLNFWSPVMAATIAIAAAVMRGGELNAAEVFAAARAFHSLMVPLWMLPVLVGRLVAATVGADRIDQLLRSERCDVQQEPLSIQRPTSTGLSLPSQSLPGPSSPVDETKPGSFPSQVDESISLSNRPIIEMINATYLTKDKSTILKDLNLCITRPGLYGITGEVASGKSFLLAALAQVVPLHDGLYILRADALGYCPVPAWIRSGTVQDNIIFDRQPDMSELERVMRAVALWGELGLDKETGEAGCSISGGQRQRVGLARALYGRPALLLVDDLLSSLDVHVATHIWNHCFAMTNDPSIRMLVTSDERRLGQCDFIITIHQSQLTITEKVAQRAPVSLPGEEVPPVAAGGPIPLPFADGDADHGHGIDSNCWSNLAPTCTDDVHCEPNWKLIGRLTAAAGGLTALILLFIVVFGTDLAQLEGDKMLRDRLRMQTLADPQATRTFLLVFMGWGFLQGLFTAGSNVLAMYLCYRASRRIHSGALERVMRAKLGVLEGTGTGRLLNRLGRDLEILDYNFPEKLISFVGCLSSILCTILAIVQLTPWLFPTFIIPLLWMAWLQGSFSRLWRALLRLTGMAMTPVTSLLTETIAGLQVIRAFKQGAITIDRLFILLDDYTMCSFLGIAARRWISLRSEVGANFYLAGLIVYCVISREDSAAVGMLLTYALRGAERIDWFIKHLAEMDQFVVSIERIAFYADKLELETDDPVEAPTNKGTEKTMLMMEQRKVEKDENHAHSLEPVRDLDASNSIDFEMMSVIYASHPALSSVTLHIASGERVAVVGRTGAGKSSLVAALLRLVDYQGVIRLGSTDIKAVSLPQLRTAITAVLQEPALFEQCSLRENLDVVGIHADAEIWSALGRVGLADLVRTRAGPLLLESNEVIRTLSTGQRQLLCVARALLARPRLLILDEATSALEPDHEAVLHRHLLDSLSPTTTIVMVTHKLAIVPLYQRVLLMEAGEIVEDGSPEELLAIESRFAHLYHARKE